MSNTTKWGSWLNPLLSFCPNTEQEKLWSIWNQFMEDSSCDIFLLKGYAGTGKTSLLSALVKCLPRIKWKSLLLAPTGRAAKVLASYSSKKAFTIHKIIYKLEVNEFGLSSITLAQNKSSNTIFIVDEASMIPEYGMEGGQLFNDRNLLADLIQFVRNGKNCKLLLVGDTAQLPPVGLDISPALDPQILVSAYGANIMQFELRLVMRQALESGILWNATELRKKIEDTDHTPPFFHTDGFRDIEKSPGGWELQEELSTSLYSKDEGHTIIVCRSNKRANLYNKEIRNRILMREEEIESGDKLMAVKNNYYWIPENEENGFIANGDLLEILRVRKIESVYGFKFADVTIRLTDSIAEKELDVKILLDTLTLETPNLPWTEQEKLWNAITEDYLHISDRRKQVEAIKNDPYYNAIQVKYAYALTCHKTQGGQWNNVFIDQGFINDEMLNQDYLRWLYTALTRAKQKVSLIGFRKDFYDTPEDD